MPDFEKPEDWTKRPHVVLIVDESGSMSISRDTTVSAINDYLGGLKTTLPAEARVTVVKFDSGYDFMPSRPLGASIFPNLGRPSSSQVRITKLFDQVPLGSVRTLTTADYAPNGGTPLHDAIGRTITEIDAAVRREPSPVFLAILTDGQENSSTEFNIETIKSLISQRREVGWTITFMGVDIDAYAAGMHFGIARGDTVNLRRSNIAASATVLSSAISERYEKSRGMDRATYGAWAGSSATFSDSDKKKLEE